MLHTSDGEVDDKGTSLDFLLSFLTHDLYVSKAWYFYTYQMVLIVPHLSSLILETTSFVYVFCVLDSKVKNIRTKYSLWMNLLAEFLESFTAMIQLHVQLHSGKHWSMRLKTSKVFLMLLSLKGSFFSLWKIRNLNSERS